jgi:hypothetical protein
MAQARETVFNPSSPHSSSGGADSYKHDGTPDTRLTAFSPEENSARSNKQLLRSLALGASSDSHPVRFQVQATESFRGSPAAIEKDPFITSSTTSKSGPKLSPTASSFRPISVPLVAHGSANDLTVLNPRLAAVDLGGRLSTDLHISRYLIIYSQTGQPIGVPVFDAYLSVNFLLMLSWLATNKFAGFGAGRHCLPRQELGSP